MKFSVNRVLASSLVSQLVELCQRCGVPVEGVRMVHQALYLQEVEFSPGIADHQSLQSHETFQGAAYISLNKA